METFQSLMARAGNGDRAALDALFSALYPELKRLARARLSGGARGGGVHTTTLVHDCYLRMLRAEHLTAGDRGQFFGYAAAVMRSVIVDAVRAAGRERRGGGAEHVPLDSTLVDRLPGPQAEILDVDAALADLARLSPRIAQVVEMRYFAGMTETEIADALGVTERTVRRDWEKARTLLAAALRG